MIGTVFPLLIVITSAGDRYCRYTHDRHYMHPQVCVLIPSSIVSHGQYFSFLVLPRRGGRLSVDRVAYRIRCSTFDASTINMWRRSSGIEQQS